MTIQQSQCTNTNEQILNKHTAKSQQVLKNGWF